MTFDPSDQNGYPAEPSEPSPDVRPILIALISMWEGWRDGIFRRLDIVWLEEPPAIRAARAYLKDH